MIASGFALFAALGAYLVVDSVLAAFYIQTDGIRYRVPFQSGMVRWQEIEKVGWSQSCQWFVLRTARGRKVRISSMLRGLPELAGALLEHLTPGQFSDEAYRLMRDAAAGIPPRLPD